ncbi:MAG: hypothetical protein KJ587_01420 [Alphaproteobacteria bacterium]|nr:hypothetical protein [Alphaproteobacteria bacterium]
MKANTVVKLVMGAALSIAVAFSATAVVSAQEAKPAAATAKAPSVCKGLDEAACSASADKNCKWIAARTVNGKDRKAHCRVVAGNPCVRLDQAACTAAADKNCKWITDALNPKGKPRKPFCRRDAK